MKQIALIVLFLSSVTLKVVCAQEKPNIIFLLADDQSSYTLSCYGNKDVKTPNIDRLSANGITFDHHYATTAICMASRATIMTGLLEYRTGTNFLHGPMSKNVWENSYPVLLKKMGYRTGFAGKFGFEVETKTSLPKNKKRLQEQTFDAWAGGVGQTSYQTEKNKALLKYQEKYPHSTLAYGAFGSDFIKESAHKKEPFCLSISFKAPHRPATPDPRFANVYKGKKFKKPNNFGRVHGEHFSKQSKQGRQYPRFNDWHYNDKYNEVMAVYHQQVYGIDQAVGMLLKALKASGADKNTVIIYTSDNGYFCGSHGYGSKVLPYEESSRVPLIIYDPRQPKSKKGIRTQVLTANTDIAPTILALAGDKMPNNIDGKELFSLYKNPTKQIHKTIPLINVWGPSETHSLSIVSKDHKYIYWGYAAKGYTATEELYDLKNDGLELHNVLNVKSKKGVLASLRTAYDKQINTWKKQVVTYNNYERYGVLLDRLKMWEDKAPLVKNLELTHKKKRKTKKTKKTKK